MFWLICNPNIFLSLSRPSSSPPPHWCGRQGTQGWCLTEPWMLYSCHTFPKRLAAAPIVAAEGGLLSWFFRPPAAALLSDGFIERECGLNNGRRHDIMLLMWAKSLCRYMIGFHRMEQNREGCGQWYFWHASGSALLRCSVFCCCLFCFSSASFSLLKHQNRNKKNVFVVFVSAERIPHSTKYLPIFYRLVWVYFKAKA